MVFGWGGSDPGPSTFLAAMKDAELVVRALNLGVDGFNRWSFINRGDLDGQWQMIETWNRETKSMRKQITPAPNSYFVYGLLSRFTAKHSRILNSEVVGGQIDGLPRVFPSALRSPGGKLTLAIINDAPQPWEANLAGKNLEGSRLFKYQVTSEDHDNPGLATDPLSTFRIESGGVAFSQKLPSMSLTLFSSYRLRSDSQGIIHD